MRTKIAEICWAALTLVTISHAGGSKVRMPRGVKLAVVLAMLSARLAFPQHVSKVVPLVEYTGVTKPRLGPDGALWFILQETFSTTYRVGRLDKRGTVETFPASNLIPADICFDGNGSMWLTDQLGDSIIHFDVVAGILLRVPLSPGATPGQIIRGPDDNLWFTEQGAGKIGRLNPTTRELVELTIADSDNPVGITAGPDGNLWFACRGGIGRVTPSGAMTLFAVPNFPYNITAGADGNLWYTERAGGGAVARITTSGVSTRFLVQSAKFLNDITTGPDGRIWFTDEVGGTVSSVSPQGAVSTIVGSYPGARSISAGGERNIWFASFDAETSRAYLNEIDFTEYRHRAVPH